MNKIMKIIFRILIYLIGVSGVISYAYLKYNVEGYWYALPFAVVIICLAIPLNLHKRER